MHSQVLEHDFASALATIELINSNKIYLQDAPLCEAMAENLFKAMSFKLPQPALKKKFFPSDDTFKECFDYGVEFAQYIK